MKKLLLLLILPVLLSAEENSITSEPQKPDPAAAAAVRELQAKTEALSAKNSELSSALSVFKEEVKALNAKCALLEKHSTEQEKASGRLEALIKELGLSLNKAAGELKEVSGYADILKTKISSIEDDSKLRSDDLKTLQDSLAIFRKNISLNAENINDCRKELAGIAAEKSSEKKNIENDPLSWPYLGAAALGVGLLSLILVLAK